ncbi:MULTISPECIES: MFS transporter [unclassified Streptomyces]|uniref:MFS transporter n=1 Tax=unclassified Streptomyces TaxID=2593676 RepID=UPI000AE50A43|nr:MFS transporter [Streptomyces sp. CB02058]
MSRPEEMHHSVRRSGKLLSPVGEITPLAAAGIVASMAVAAFSFVTTENLPIGLLSLIAGDLNTSVSSVGLLVTCYGLTVAVVSVPAAKLTLGIPRRILLIRILGIFLVATWISAAAPSYWVLLLARLLTSLSQAVFWAVVAPTVAGLFQPAVRGRILALTFSGASLGGVLGVPAATWIGQSSGWRIAFMALSGLTALALVVVILRLPDTDPEHNHASRGTDPDRRVYALVVSANALMVAGVFTTYTYLVAFLDEVSGFAARSITPMLLVYGAAGVLGGLAAGAASDRYPRLAFTAPSAVLVGALGGLYAFGEDKGAVIACVSLAGFACACVPIATQNRIMQVAPGSTDVASAGNSAAFNLGIASGALIGGVLVETADVRSVALVGAVLAAAALTLALIEPALPRRAPGGSPRTGECRAEG